MKRFTIISTIIFLILAGVQTWYSIPEVSKQWFLRTTGFPLGIVPFILWSIVSAILFGYLLWTKGRVIGSSIYNGINAIIPHISWKKENAVAEFKCNFDADVLVGKLKPLINTAPPVQPPELDVGVKETPLDFLKRELDIVETGISEADGNGMPYPKFIYPRMAAIKQILPDAPDPSLRSNEMAGWMSFIGKTKANIVTGKLEIP